MLTVRTFALGHLLTQVTVRSVATTTIKLGYTSKLLQLAASAKTDPANI